MRRLLLALPFALLPLAVAHAHDHDHDHEHGSLGKHEHGVATLNVALEGNTLEIELESPAMNIVGFEHAATSDADKKTVAAARAKLEKPLALFSLPAAAGCSLTEHELSSPLFGDAEDKHDHDHDHDHDEHADGHDHDHEHSDIDADYSFTCKQPDALKTVDLTAFYKQFPATQKINVQLIGPNGQKGVESTPANARLTF
ncbi:DUF2796 domain-containing protein [Phytopseudomonas seleniipraecipitans]|uniref:Zinc-binding protein n=1 Tax=Phytopseudomonas seleniipraecipitans TaxID=640205 RepID=A0A1G7TK62_9GAMM|nr:DUF2796 domain-containing protein [Pseudomonas seleniipraecipitans]SDG35723.1 Protein of unknown function [Pseudomonas seleniipraecipitans]